MPRKAVTPRIPNGRYRALQKASPEVIDAYDRLSAACLASGPLPTRTTALIKVAVSVGLGSWGSVHAHARKALEAGVTPDELRHVATIALPTLGLPAALGARKWIEESIAEHGGKRQPDRNAPRTRDQ